MRRPVVGIIANFYMIHDDYPAQATGRMNIDAIADVTGALPVIIPSLPSATDIPALIDTFDGFLFTGGQEFNVAYGGTLHPEIRDIPGRMNHRMPPDGTLEEKFALRHEIALTPGGKFSRVFGSDAVMVNSLHGQGIEDAGARIVVEGHAPDGTPEAIHVEGATGFAMAVQWHPEYEAHADPVSKPLFEAFGNAVGRWAAGEAWAAE